MSNYTQTTFFAPKDALASGNPDKTIYGAEVDPELSAISAAIATKVDTAGTGLEVSSSTLSLSLTDLTAATPVAADQLVFADSSDSNNEKKVTLANLLAASVGTSTQVISNLLEIDINAMPIVATPSAANDYLALYDASAGTLTKVTIDNAFASVSGFVNDSRTLTAGTGLSGGGDLSTDRTFAVDLNELTTETSAATGDFIAMVDITDFASGKISVANLGSSISSSVVHDSTSGFVSNEHIDHTAVVLTAGVGLSGGGSIAASRTFTVDLNELTTETSIASGDFIAMVDITDSGSGKITLANLQTALSITESQISDLGTYLEDGFSVSTGTITTGTVTTLRSDTFNLGHASDTTITRVAAGQAAVEGDAVFTHDSGTYTSAKIFFSNGVEPTTEGANGDIFLVY